MRTPGNDIELAAGFLFAEGIICDTIEIESIKHCNDAGRQAKDNIVRVELKPDIKLDWNKLIRNFYTTSSCGVCGKASIEAISTIGKYNTEIKKNIVKSSLFNTLLTKINKEQTVFKHTGALHAAALFSFSAELLCIREDVGRHNALDKLIGYFFVKNELPLHNKILWLSGRLSFELVQKAYMAGISIVVALGAPSSLSVQLAEEKNITLIGFLKENSFNIYTHSERISF
jgi:FdhD protein